MTSDVAVMVAAAGRAGCCEVAVRAMASPSAGATALGGNASDAARDRRAGPVSGPEALAALDDAARAAPVGRRRVPRVDLGAGDQHVLRA